MNNGCICCTVRGDLIRILDGLMKRKGKFDAIIVETTGLADPAPVAQTFFVDEDVGEARAARRRRDRRRRQMAERPAQGRARGQEPDRLRRRHRAQQDRSRDAEAELAEVEAAHPRHQPLCQAAHAPSAARCRSSDVLDRNAFDLDRILEIEPEFLDAGDGHDHDHASRSSSRSRPWPQPWRPEALPRRGHAIAVAALGQAARPRPSSCRGCRTWSPARARRFCAPRAFSPSRTTTTATCSRAST